MPTTITRKLLQCSNYFPFYCPVFPCYVQFVVLYDGFPIWFEAIYTTVFELITIKAIQLILTNFMRGCKELSYLPFNFFTIISFRASSFTNKLIVYRYKETVDDPL